MDEFKSLVPNNLDRAVIDARSIKKLGYETMAEMKSTQDWYERRSSFVRNIGINYASRLMPIILRQCENTFSKLRPGKLNMSEEASKLTFDIITSILFGEDINTTMDLCPYYDPATKQILQLNAHDSITRLAEDQAF